MRTRTMQSHSKKGVHSGGLFGGWHADFEEVESSVGPAGLHLVLLPRMAPWEGPLTQPVVAPAILTTLRAASASMTKCCV